MEWHEVLERIEAGEDHVTEYKRGLGDLKSVGRTICAFANTEGGLILLGVDDEGAVVGVQDNTEAVQERIASFLHTGCSAPVSAHPRRHRDSRGWVHWIEIPRQRGHEPFRYAGRVWVRRGRSNVEPSPVELQELYNTFGYILTEGRMIESAGGGDIDLTAFRAYLGAQGLDIAEEPQPSPESDLRNRGVLAELDGTLRSTLYGVLAFGRDPQRYPQTASFYVECVAYAGSDRASDTVLVGEGKGRLDEQVERALGWVRGLGRLEAYRGLIRKDIPLVPEKALREAIVNAVAHRDYAITGSKILVEVFCDRIQVTSPGTLPNHMTVESVRAGGHPRSRNESIAHFLNVRGFMEQRGRGWPVMRRAMREFNGSDAELVQEEGGPFVRVILRFQVGE